MPRREKILHYDDTFQGFILIGWKELDMIQQHQTLPHWILNTQNWSNLYIMAFEEDWNYPKHKLLLSVEPINIWCLGVFSGG